MTDSNGAKPSNDELHELIDNYAWAKDHPMLFPVESKQLRQAAAIAHLASAELQRRQQPQTAGQYCPMCGSPEVDHYGPATKYACGSTDFDQRPGTFKESDRCNRIRLRIPLPPEPPTC